MLSFDHQNHLKWHKWCHVPYNCLWPILRTACTIFFWTNGHEIVPISLIEKNSITGGPVTKNYSCGIIDAKFFAPAIAQMTASALIFYINLVADVSFRLKTLLFRSFQTSQLISMVRLRTTFFFGTTAVAVMFSHQVSALSLGLHLFGLSSGYAIHSAASCQILLVYLHSESKWCADFMTPLQRGMKASAASPSSPFGPMIKQYFLKG